MKNWSAVIIFSQSGARGKRARLNKLDRVRISKNSLLAAESQMLADPLDKSLVCFRL